MEEGGENVCFLTENCPYLRSGERYRAKIAINILLLIGSRRNPYTRHENRWLWMTLKGHYAFCYANRAILWLSGKLQGVSDGNVG